MKIGITSRADLQEALELTKKITNHLKREEFEIAPKVGEKLGISGVPIEDMEIEALVTVGGDGTVLSALQKSSDKPILGINMGGRGFLADVNPDETLEAVDKLRQGKLDLIERERLSVEISGEKLAEALNEGVIRSKEPGRVLSFKVLIDGEEVEETRGDGLIVATPTGSTAYAMAAGGPIVETGVKAHIAVPLSTHRPKLMPLVYPADSELVVELLEYDGKATVTVDGQVTGVAREEDKICFKRSENTVKFYKWKGKFYEKLKEKL